MTEIQEKVAVLDFGGQYAHLIANRIRRLGTFTEILPPYSDVKELASFKGIVFSGGPSSVYAEDAPKYNPAIIDLPVPKLGICYGHQLISQHLGGTVQPGHVKEYGTSRIHLTATDHPLLQGVQENSPMWMSHGDMVSKLAPGFKSIAVTPDCDTAAVANDALQIYGLQFHPEVTHSQYGQTVLQNFLRICNCNASWNMKQYLDTITVRIQEQCENKKVFLLVSGGVDSTVAFVLLNSVLGKDRVLGLHIDNGMMRLNESELVKDFLHKESMDNLVVVNASAQFLKNLSGISAPEEKRKIIGDTFLQIKEEQTNALQLDPDEWLLAQGTIYPDTIESGGTENADVIKTHHNRVQAVIDLLALGKIIEPLADLYKDEVRLLGEELGIPKHLVWRHPFPGPGLGVRLLCSFASADTHVQSQSLESFLQEKCITGEILPISSVGVQGDARTYAHPLLINSPLSWQQAEDLSTLITNRFAIINRLVYQIGAVSSQQPVLVEQYCTKDKLDALRIFDNICTEFLLTHKLYDTIWQMPVVLLPLTINGKPALVMRPVNSSEAMTANFAEIDQTLLQNELWPALCNAGAGALYYDITHKPPGTIEWE